MGYSPLAHVAYGDLIPETEINQSRDNEIQLKAWVDESDKALMTNKSGGNLSTGAVVIFDATNDAAFTTTTNDDDRRVCGVLWEAINNNASGLVVVGKRRATVLVQGNVTRGNWLSTSTTAGRAKDSGSKVKPAYGAVGLAMTSYGGGGAGSVEALTDLGLEVSNYSGNFWSLGGYQGANVATAYKWDVGTDTTSSVGTAGLSTARRNMACGQSTTKGFASGGYVAGESAIVDALVFATSITAATNSRVTARAAASGSQSSTDLYASRGGVSSAMNTTREKMNLATETWATLTASALGGQQPAGGSGPVNNYSAGGDIAGPSVTSNVYRTANATDVETALGSTLPAARAEASSGVDRPSVGCYFIAGSDGSALQTTGYKLTFATEATSNVGSAAVGTGRRTNADGSDGISRGFILGGNTTVGRDNPAGPTAIADAIAFATETTAAVSGANYPIATGNAGGVYG